MATPATATTPAAQPTQQGNNQVLLVLAWVFAFVFSVVGLILSIIGRNKGDSRFKAPLIVSIVMMVLGAVLYFMF